MLHSDKPFIAALKRALLMAWAVPAIDFNDINTRRSIRGASIPIGVEGKASPTEKERNQPASACVSSWQTQL